MPLKLFNIFGIGLFVFLAYLSLSYAMQYSHFEMWLWFGIYSLASLFNLLSLGLHIPKNIFLIWIGFLSGSILFNMPNDNGILSMDIALVNQDTIQQFINLPNEAIGLILVLSWAILQLCLNRKKNVMTPW